MPHRPRCTPHSASTRCARSVEASSPLAARRDASSTACVASGRGAPRRARRGERRPSARMEAYSSTRVETYSSTRVEAFSSTRMEAYSSTRVEAYSSTRMEAFLLDARRGRTCHCIRAARNGAVERVRVGKRRIEHIKLVVEDVALAVDLNVPSGPTPLDMSSSTRVAGGPSPTSAARAAGVDGQDVLHDAVPVHDPEVVEVRRRIAVRRREPQLGARLQGVARLQVQDAVLVAARPVGPAALHERRAGHEVHGLGARVDDRAPGRGRREHRREHLEGPRKGGRAGPLLDGAVLLVHEAKRSRLHLVEDAAVAVEEQRARAAPGDDRRRQPHGAQRRPRAPHHVGHFGHALRAVRGARHVLDEAVVHVRAREAQAPRRRDALRQLRHGFPRRHAAARLAHVHLNITIQHDPAERGVQRGDLRGVVHEHAHFGRALGGRGRDARDLVGAHDLVREQDVRHARRDHGFQFSHRLRAHARRAEQRELLDREGAALVRLGVRPRADGRAGEAVLQRSAVALERVRVQQ
mmetsp:Transcript_5132/g.15222  ORF Transcript_5132/g.15222 Transcript_5132/m.15222 type:complete len:524 (-) Transcript_5132:160-1731(-)